MQLHLFPVVFVSLPLPSNFAAHSLLRINAKGEVSTTIDKRTRSSHIASRTCYMFQRKYNGDIVIQI